MRQAWRIYSSSPLILGASSDTVRRWENRDQINRIFVQNFEYVKKEKAGKDDEEACRAGERNIQG